ncbi:MAG TPA: DUF2288 family protein [Candidatus Tenderia sp.]|nr:DUF2288 family protein [Candidatus Tenderia sp.]
MSESDPNPVEHLRQESETRLNTETAKIAWPELERHFARGVVVRVAKGLDLLKVAVAMVDDDKSAVNGWLKAGLVARATDKDAKRWSKEQPLMWAVVVAPWVVVQEAQEEA